MICDISLGIPTYNRSPALLDYLKKVEGSSILSSMKLIISNNDSTDDTEQVVLSSGLNNVKYYKQATNVGAQKNLLALFDLCDTKYIIISSDEDPIVEDVLGVFLDFLAENEPVFVSPILKTREGVIRGNEKSRLISISDFQYAAGAMSGLVFEVAEARRVVSEFRHLLEDPDQQWAHTLVAIKLMIDFPGRCWYWGNQLNEPRFYLPGGFIQGHIPLCASLSHFVSTSNCLHAFEVNCEGDKLDRSRVATRAHRVALGQWIRKGIRRIDDPSDWQVGKELINVGLELLLTSRSQAVKYFVTLVVRTFRSVLRRCRKMFMLISSDPTK
jgi:glycosyltransferase involved in cell wall biosynthesis